MAGWRESAFQLLLTLIASSLLASVVAAVASDYSKPRILTSLSSIQSENQTSYQVSVSNVGRGAATNMRLSMFFPANITSYFPIVYADNMTIDILRNNIMVHSPPDNDYYGNPSEYEPSMVIADIPRFSSGSKAIFGITTISPNYAPLYVSATYDQGSEDFFIPAPTNTIQFQFPSILAERPINVPVTSQMLVIVSVVSSVLFGIAIKQIRDKRNLHRSLYGIENEIRAVRQKLQDEPTSQKKFSTKIWNSRTVLDKHRIAKSNEDYQALDAFFDALAKRDSISDKLFLGMYNKECYRLATNALTQIEWSKYYGEKHVDDNTINILLGLLIAVPIAVFLLFLTEELPLKLLEPSIFISPPDISDIRAGSVITDSDGKTWLVGGLVDISATFSIIAFIARGFFAFLIVRYVLSHAFKTRHVDNESFISTSSPPEKNFLESLEVNKIQQTKLLGYSFLIMGFPMWSIVNLFFNSAAYRAFNFDSSPLFLTVVLVEVLRFATLMVLIPILIQKGKIRVTSDVTDPRHKGLLLFSSAVIFLSGVFHLVFAGILMEQSLFNPYPATLFSQILIVLGLIQLGWAVVLRKKRSRIIYFASIGAATALILLWGFILAIFIGTPSALSSLIDHQSRLRFLDPYSLLWTILLGTAGILVLQMVHVGLTMRVLRIKIASEKDA